MIPYNSFFPLVTWILGAICLNHALAKLMYFFNSAKYHLQAEFTLTRTSN